MSIFDKILLALYSLCITAVSLVLIALPTGFVKQDFVINQILYVMSRWETCGVAAVFLLASLRFLKISLSGSGKVSYDEAVVLCGESGQVRIAVSAVRELIEKTAQHEAGVNSAKAEVHVQAAKKDAMETADVRIRIKLSVIPEAHVPTLGDKVQQKVKNVLNESVGMRVDDIVVFVDTISHEQKKRVIQ